MANVIISKTKIAGPFGQLATTLYQPKVGSHRLCILMHGFMASQRHRFLRRLAERLTTEGLAVLTFDFDGHGKSDGRFVDMTVETELADAEAVYRYAKQLPWVQMIYLAGHSQGGVVAGLLAGRLGAERIAGVLQLAPAAVLHDDAVEGHIMNAKFNPQQIPDYVRVFFIKKVGRAYFEVAQQLDIYGESCLYKGPVCLIHGTVDDIVPYRYSQQYDAGYANSMLHLIEGENHMFSRQPNAVIELAAQWFDVLSSSDKRMD